MLWSLSLIATTLPSPERHALWTPESGGETLAPRSVHALEPVCHSYTSTYSGKEVESPTSRREPSSEKDKIYPGLSDPLLVNVAPIWVHEALPPCPAISRAVDLPERRRKTATHSHRVRVARGSAVEFCLVSVMSGSRCSSVTCGVGGGGVGSAAGRGEETHGDAVAKPPKSGIARKATEAVGARGLARFGDAETCARDLRPPSRRQGNYPSTAPRGGRATRKRGIRHSSFGRTSARIRVLRVGGRRVSRVSLVRGAGANIGRGGGARVRAGPGGRLRLSFRAKYFFLSRNFYYFWKATATALPAASSDAASSVDFV